MHLGWKIEKEKKEHRDSAPVHPCTGAACKWAEEKERVTAHII